LIDFILVLNTMFPPSITILVRGSGPLHSGWRFCTTMSQAATHNTHTQSCCVPADWEMEKLPIIEITAPVWNPADLQMSRPHSSFPRVVNCIFTASRDMWTESATLQLAISPSLDCRCVSSRYSGNILVHGAPMGTANISAAFTSERHSNVNFENLSRKCNIGLETAKCTSQVTTQQGFQTAVHPLHCRYRVDHLNLNRRRLNGDWFTDTLFSKVALIQRSLLCNSSAVVLESKSRAVSD
jgi:hypothetical protein